MLLELFDNVVPLWQPEAILIDDDSDGDEEPSPEEGRDGLGRGAMEGVFGKKQSKTPSSSEQGALSGTLATGSSGGGLPQGDQGSMLARSFLQAVNLLTSGKAEKPPCGPYLLAHANVPLSISSFEPGRQVAGLNPRDLNSSVWPFYDVLKDPRVSCKGGYDFLMPPKPGDKSGARVAAPLASLASLKEWEFNLLESIDFSSYAHLREFLHYIAKIEPSMGWVLAVHEVYFAFERVVLANGTHVLRPSSLGAGLIEHQADMARRAAAASSHWPLSARSPADQALAEAIDKAASSSKAWDGDRDALPRVNRYHQGSGSFGQETFKRYGGAGSAGSDTKRPRREEEPLPAREIVPDAHLPPRAPVQPGVGPPVCSWHQTPGYTREQCEAVNKSHPSSRYMARFNTEKEWFASYALPAMELRFAEFPP